MVITAMASPPSVLLLHGAGRDGDPLARDVVQDVDLIAQGTACEHLEDLEGRLQRTVRTLPHQIVDRGHRESLHRSPPEVAQSLAQARVPNKWSFLSTRRRA